MKQARESQLVDCACRLVVYGQEGASNQGRSNKTPACKADSTPFISKEGSLTAANEP